MQTTAPVCNPIKKRTYKARGKATVETLVKTGVPVKIARETVYKRQYEHMKKNNYQAQRKYDAKKKVQKILLAGLQGKHKQPTLSIVLRKKSLPLSEWHL